MTIVDAWALKTCPAYMEMFDSSETPFFMAPDINLFTELGNDACRPPWEVDRRMGRFEGIAPEL